MAKSFHIKGDDICDGFHTFDELYDHRCLLFINLCLMTSYKSVRRSDADGWFFLFLELPSGQISYHVPTKFIHLVRSIPVDDRYFWDQHKPFEVVERLIETAELLQR
jgi:hypothetical protein